MPWKECHVMDERLRFVARLLEGEKMAPLCAEFGISRKTGYKIFERYKDYGVHGLTDRSRRPYRHANQLPPVLEPRSSGSSGITQIGAHPRFARSSAGAAGRCPARRSAPSMRSSIGMGSSSGGGAAGAARPARRSHTPRRPMRCGVPTTRASFGSATGSIAIRSR